MNLQQLRQIVEVEKTANITQAAKNLFMGQPNLSKSIKELESEIGITLFTRTAKGVEPTSEGLEFLQYAHGVLLKMDELIELYSPRREHVLDFTISVPRATYASVAFANFVGSLDESIPMNVQYKETNPHTIITDVSTGQSTLGILRYQTSYEKYFLNLLEENNLQYEMIWEYRMQLLMSQEHPLAAHEEISYQLLKDYIELTHGDFQVAALNPTQLKEISQPIRRICIYDRGSQFYLLKQVKGTYLWVSPVPESVLAERGLVQRPCPDVGINKDCVIYHRNKNLKPYERGFIERLKKEISSL